MTEYFREPNNRIQAGFAQHTGKLLVQYRDLTVKLRPTHKYEATLAVCALQALLTNCTELMSSMQRDQRGFWSAPIPDIGQGHWGISSSFVVRNTFPDELTYEKFITHLRNALSHPTSADRAPKHPTTGYTTVSDGTGVITKFRFTDSPWVDRGCIHSKASSSDEEKINRTLSAFLRNRKDANDLDVRSTQGKYQIYKGNKLYLPIFVAELSMLIVASPYRTPAAANTNVRAGAAIPTCSNVRFVGAWAFPFESFHVAVQPSVAAVAAETSSTKLRR